MRVGQSVRRSQGSKHLLARRTKACFLKQFTVNLPGTPSVEKLSAQLSVIIPVLTMLVCVEALVSLSVGNLFLSQKTHNTHTHRACITDTHRHTHIRMHQIYRRGKHTHLHSYCKPWRVRAAPAIRETQQQQACASHQKNQLQTLPMGGVSPTSSCNIARKTLVYKQNYTTRPPKKQLFS